MLSIELELNVDRIARLVWQGAALDDARGEDGAGEACEEHNSREPAGRPAPRIRGGCDHDGASVSEQLHAAMVPRAGDAARGLSRSPCCGTCRSGARCLALARTPSTASE